ncbi:hypothetical protein AJ80_05101 [Polytolypa hystricis UAMH7299]|uniref:F-box domain-containing protein n=1 Tax=Polytolypa hystricis (strain UAMH7299) TaxID=1447883 RepID=A0A2B7Y5M7_POLH7|nr:hypothetical protein AJ80_05101 [Polytolypa hystricis UAMH7299]
MANNPLPRLSWPSWLSWFSLWPVNRDRRAREAHHHNSRLENNLLLGLPAEMLLMVYQHLPSFDSISLTLTCSTLYYSSISSDVHRRLKSSNTARFEMFCLLEEDGLVRGYCC